VMINFHNCDCVDFMIKCKNNEFDLAIVDPPYGIGEDWKKRSRISRKYRGEYQNDKIPDKKYFSELFRVSKNQIIWGYNYYTEILGPTNYIIFWDKLVGKGAFYSHGELAYSSFKIPLIKITIPWDGARKGTETGTDKIHPHQKPIELYRQLLLKFAKSGDKILDTHGGSMVFARACYEFNYNLDIIEKDLFYFDLSKKEFYKYMKKRTKENRMI